MGKMEEYASAKAKFEADEAARVAEPDPKSMSVKKLKAFIKEQGMSFAGCYEKSELVNKAIEALGVWRKKPQPKARKYTRPKPTGLLTPLHVAAAKGFDSMCALLLSKGADVNAQDFNGDTALHMAGKAAEESTWETLKSKGAKSSIANKDGEKPKLSKQPAGCCVM